MITFDQFCSVGVIAAPAAFLLMLAVFAWLDVRAVRRAREAATVRGARRERELRAQLSALIHADLQERAAIMAREMVPVRAANGRFAKSKLPMGEMRPARKPMGEMRPVR